jgi:NTE family protein
MARAASSKVIEVRPSPTRTAPTRRTPTVALALGGGGARGLAHILALEAFEELGIRPTAIAGTSIGALFGAAYASGLTARELRAIAEDTLGQRFDLIRQMFAARSSPVQRLLSIVPLRSALLDAEALIGLILPPKIAERFEQLTIPFSAVATDISQNEAVIFTSGPLRPAVAASIAIPVLFSPVQFEGRPLLDGGLVNPLPFDLLHGAADIVVAIDVSGASKPAGFRRATPTTFEVMMQSVQILEKSITREKVRARPPDIYIDVDLDKFGALEFHKAKEILAAAEPVKAHLRQQLARICSAETLDVLV